MSKEGLSNLRFELGPQLREPEQVVPPPGVPTGWPVLDSFLLWQGFPKGALTLMTGTAGGATTLWMESAARTTRSGLWTAWINAPDSSLTPWNLRRRNADLRRLLCVSAPQDDRQLLWSLQELMSLNLFELIGCDVSAANLKAHQVLKLKHLARRHQTAIVLLQHSAPARIANPSLYSLILNFEKSRMNVLRALHRQTPHSMERRDLYADTLPLLAAGRRALCG